MSVAAGLVGNALARWVELVIGFSKTVLLLSFVAAGAAIWYAAGNLGINTDTADMISPTLPWRQDFINYRDAFPARDRNVVAVVDASSPQQADAFAAALAERLERETALFISVFLPGAGAFFERNGLLYLSVDELESLSDRLARAQPLLGLLERRFNGAGVVAVAEQAIEGRPGASGSAVDGADSQAFEAELARVLESAAAGRDRPFDWERLLSGGSGETARELVLLQPVVDFTRIQPAGAAIERLREIAADLEADFDGEATVRLTGTVAMEHEELVSVTRGASVAGLAALALVTLVLYWVLRSIRLIAVSVATLLLGLAGTAGFAAAAVGHLNLLSVAFAVLYVGLGVDFILHYCLRVKELVAEGVPVAVGVTEAARGVGTSLVICAVTTAAGFYAFIPTPFQGVSELGLISGTGMFVSLIVSLTVLPAFLVNVGPRAFHRRDMPGAACFRLGTPPPRTTLAAALIVVVATCASIPWVSFDNNPIHLRDPQSESVATIEELAADSDAPLLNLVAIADGPAAASRWAGALQSLPEVREVRTVASLVPDAQEDKILLLEDIGLFMGPGFADLERLPADPEELRTALEDLRRSVEGDTEAGQRLAAALDALLAALARDDADAATARLTTLDAALTSDLPQQLERLATGVAAEPFGRDALPPDLTERWLNGGRELIEIVPAENVNDNAAAERFVDAVRSIVPNATGLPVVHQEASGTVIESFQLAMLYATVLVTVLLLVFLRRIVDTILVLVPIAFAAGATAGITVWLGIPFNFANIIALPLLLGVGVDNGIHMVHRMRAEPPRDGELVGTSTSRAVLASGLTTIASFGNLAFSPHVGMASMGQLLTLGMTMMLLATLVLLPALLKLRGDR
jgi:uncharacterized protein